MNPTKNTGESAASEEASFAELLEAFESESRRTRQQGDQPRRGREVPNEHTRHLVEFIRRSERGICRE